MLSRSEIIAALRKMGYSSLADLKRHCRHYERQTAAVEENRSGRRDASATGVQDRPAPGLP